MDLLSNLDAARSARVRSHDCRDREIPASIMAAADKLFDLALAACSRADRLCPMAGRRRLHQLHCLRLAVSPACHRHGRAADLRA